MFFSSFRDIFNLCNEAVQMTVKLEGIPTPKLFGLTYPDECSKVAGRLLAGFVADGFGGVLDSS